MPRGDFKLVDEDGYTVVYNSIGQEFMKVSLHNQRVFKGYWNRVLEAYNDGELNNVLYEVKEKRRMRITKEKIRVLVGCPKCFKIESFTMLEEAFDVKMKDKEWNLICTCKNMYLIRDQLIGVEGKGKDYILEGELK